MSRKSLIICSILSCFAIVGSFYYFNKTEKPTQKVAQVQEQVEDQDSLQTSEETEISQEAESEVKQEIVVQDKSKLTKTIELSVNKDEHIKNIPTRHVDLYNEYSQMPFSAIAALADMPEAVNKSIKKIAELNNMYYLGKTNDKVLIIVGTSERYSRHDIEFVEIDSKGKPKIIPFGSHAVNDLDMGGEWEFDEVSKMPLKHVKHNSKGVVEYTEVWNYSPDESIKYEMRDREDKVVSIKKETPDGLENKRIDHLIYDNEGKTKMSVSINYDGPNLTGFTFYSAEHPQAGGTLLNEYSNDGLKIKEAVYNTEYNLKNTYRAEYKDGEKVNLKISDKDEMVEILSEK